MPENEKVLFGAEMDGGGFNTGVNEIVDQFKKLKAAQGDLQKGIAGFTTSLKLSEEQLKDVDKEIKNLNKSSKDYATQLDILQKKQLQIRNDQKTVTTGLVESEKQLNGVNNVLKVYNKNLGEFQEKHTATGKALEKFTSLSHYAAEGVNIMRSHVAELSVGLVSGFAGAILAFAEPAIENFIESLLSGGEAAVKLAEKHKLMNEVFEEAAKSVGKGVAQLEVFKQKLNDTTLSEKDRITVAKEYNKVADEQNKIDLKQIDNLQLINEKLEAQNQLILQRAIAVSATSKLGTFADKLVEAQLKLGEKLQEANTSEKDFLEKATPLIAQRDKLSQQVANTGGLSKPGESRAALSQKQSDIDAQLEQMFGAGQLNAGGIADLIETRNKVKEAMDEALKTLGPLITVPGLTTTGGDTKTIENVFLEKLREFRAKLAAVSAKDFLSDTIIEKKFSAQLDKEYGDIAKLIKEKKLTVSQGDILKGVLKQINDVELSKELDEFHKKQQDALQQIDEIISSSSIDLANKTIANIRDEFERESQSIEAGYQATAVQLEDRLNKLLQKVQDDLDKGIIKDQTTASEKSNILRAIFGDLLTQAGIDRTNRQLELAFKSFQKTIQTMKDQFESDNLDLSETSTKRIQSNAEAYVRGTISYQTYQKNLTKILRDEAAARRILQLNELRDELKSIDARLAATTDPGQLEKLKKQQQQVRNEISRIEREANNQDAQEREELNKKRIDGIIAYANAIQGLLSQIASFWQQVNSVEAASLDRSIALQEKRVERARDIAEKGNAEYLEMEEKRLDELERKREENARRQMAINQALTLSQALVATVSAIAQAVSTGSPLAAIAAVAAVVGAIAAGYAFVGSLQPVSANFYEGTEYVEGRGRPRGKDTVPARLTIGERVVTAQRNQEYWDSLHAIHNKLIPPDILNNFVNQYPTLNFNRLEEATTHKLSLGGEVKPELDRLNTTMEKVVGAIAGIGINLSMDEDGFSASIASFLHKKAMLKRS
jgi:hypothetical protein